jgi:heat shock protein HslJ
MKIKAILLVVIVALLALPTLAQQQQTTTTTIGYNDFSFSVDPTWAGHIGINRFAGDPTTLEQPGGPEAKHIEFLVSDSVATENMSDATLAIRLYHVADFGAYKTQQATFEQLQNLLNTQPELSMFTTPMMEDGSNTLPFLPIMPASQVVRSQVRYLKTDAVHGITYVTAYRQDAAPFMSHDFYYTFQGISTDGVYYVSVVGRPITALFPMEIGEDFDYETFTAGFAEYMNQSIATLNAGLETDFSPSLSAFDAVVMSFNFGDGMVMPVEPVAVPTADASLGGLGGSWMLISYGSPDSPITPLPETPVTVAFSGQGVSGTAGCNTFSGAFNYNDGLLTIAPLVSTLMACEESVMSQETAVMTALQAATSYELVDGQLRIAYPDGMLVFALGAS